MSAAACYLCLAPAAVAVRSVPLCEVCSRALAAEHSLWLAAAPLDERRREGLHGAVSQAFAAP